MQSHNNVVQTKQGVAISGATIKVYNSGTSTLSTIYSDNGSTAIDQSTSPLTSSAEGEFKFWAADGRYDITTTYSSQTDTYEIILFDPIGGGSTTDINIGGDVEIGDPGTEIGGINVNGTTYDCKIRVNDIGGTKPAQLSLHRHSTTLQSIILGTRANSDTSAHAAVTNSQALFSIIAGGWTASHYDLFGSIDFEVDATGTISATSSPGVLKLKTTPDGSNTPSTAVTVDSSQNVGIGISTPDTNLHIWNGSAGAVNSTTNALLTIENNASAYIQILSPSTSGQGIYFGDENDSDIGGILYNHSGNTLTLRSSTISVLQVDDDATAGNTRLLIYDVDNATLERVSVGAADSGGAGYKVLRIPN